MRRATTTDAGPPEPASPGDPAAPQGDADIRGCRVRSRPGDSEWHDGYRRRLGIVYADCETRRRLPKDSGLGYRDVIRRNGLAP
ncbi:family 1 glycosylhydrolase [Sphaerisporangium sp. NPDC088356]|uniref:family 1 glycosylhydrolase n=1 Tax=Sphaerisporangium sp. NPDC088356 TaxID=3154871 RepID=UPI0034454B2A